MADLVDEFYCAVEEGDLQIIRELLNNGVDVNTPLEDCDTFLMLAISCQNLEVVKALVEAGADINRISYHGSTALILAAMPQRAAIFRYLAPLASDEVRQYSLEQALMMAASKGEFPEVIDFVLEARGDINAYDEDSDYATALMMSVLFRRVVFTQALIAKGANINILNSRGRTALMIAARSRHLMELRERNYWETQTEIVELLINAGANLEVTDSDGKTALIHAAEFGPPLVVELLLKSGASLDIRDSEGKSTLDCARESEALIAKDRERRSEIIRILEEAIS
ncbi:ankyrin repeat domain-containing protein [Vacuolonema iberomarrocanum]|uniref:ankyrin repeat domain-containing protein n=1 Tax=Vacuolonema iberomarrocanum TaxID=3454632 RepID=UPI0019E796CB|nr:ankyrin repeat domain-containing protein [filamentous cyanobacterium LEGE 07170]